MSEPLRADANPYDAPKAPPTRGARPSVAGREAFREMDTKSLTKLYHRSINVGCVGVLLTIGGLALTSLPLWAPANVRDGLPLGLCFGVGAFQLVAAYGCFARPGWAPITGVLACVGMLLGKLLGIIVGIVGIFAFLGAPRLFGADRIRHAALKAEVAHRKLTGAR